jgi:hypothetical protein
LSAIAASKGHHAIAQIVTELSPDGIEECISGWTTDEGLSNANSAIDLAATGSELG